MEPQNHKIQYLIDKYLTKELLLPAMQRKYVWRQSQARDLLDSVYRGYPSGSILIWETDIVPETRDSAIESNEGQAMTKRLLLLDGQQRITSLASIMTGRVVRVKEGGELKEKHIEIYFNLDHPEEVEFEEDGNRELFFQIKSRKIENNPNWISVTKLFKEGVGSILKNLKIGYEHPKYELYNARLNKLYSCKENYFYPVQLLRNMSYGEVTEVFVRVNSAGTRLRGSDLALAQITSRWNEAIHIFEQYLEEVAKHRFYLDDALLVRCITAVATEQSKFKALGRTPIDEIKAAWAKTHKALDYTINFIKENAGIESTHLFDSNSTVFSLSLLVPLVVYFAEHPDGLTEGQEKSLLYWFFAAHMWGRYSGSTETRLDQDLKALTDEKPADVLMKNLQMQAGKRDVTPDDLAMKGQNSPFFLMSYLVAKNNDAKDWFTGVGLSTVNIGPSHKIEIHHIFPRTLIEKDYSKEAVNEIANFAFLSQKANRKISKSSPENYLLTIAKERLSAQKVSLKEDLWKLERFEDFLIARRSDLAEAINDFMKKFGQGRYNK